MNLPEIELPLTLLLGVVQARLGLILGSKTTTFRKAAPTGGAHWKQTFSEKRSFAGVQGL